MAAKPPDFALLYARLDLPPDCTLAQFKHACRQRIAELHPDRTPSGTATTSDLGISELLSLYAGAVRFHRRHGRLPGAHAVARAPEVQAPPPAPIADMADAGETATPSSPRAWALAALAATLLLALLAVFERETPDIDALPATAANTEATAPPLAVDARIAPAQPRLALGMDQATVRAIQGEPMQYDDRDWIYGPSWIRFEKGRVVDWYSSPLRRLHTAKQAPTQDEIDAATPP